MVCPLCKEVLLQQSEAVDISDSEPESVDDAGPSDVNVASQCDVEVKAAMYASAGNQPGHEAAVGSPEPHSRKASESEWNRNIKQFFKAHESICPENSTTIRGFQGLEVAEASMHAEEDMVRRFSQLSMQIPPSHEAMRSKEALGPGDVGLQTPAAPGFMQMQAYWSSTCACICRASNTMCD